MEKTTGNAYRRGLSGMLLLLGLLAAPNTGICAVDPNAVYFFAATGYNDSGLETVDFSLAGNDEETPQAVTITSPSSEELAQGTVPVLVSVPQAVAVARVQFFVDGIFHSEAAAEPFRFAWNTSALLPGAHSLMVKATDAEGSSVASDQLEVTIAGDITPPSVLLSGPANTSTVKGTVTLSAGAQDNAAVTRIELYLDGNLLAGNDQSSVTYEWNTASAANGGHVLSAKAYDAAGNAGESNLLTVSVLNDTISPVVALASPASSTVTGTVALSATATDDVAVTKVDFYVNGVLEATTVSAPYAYNWNTAALANGSYTISAKAYDAAGNVGSSAERTVNIFYDRTAPAITTFTMPEYHNSTTVPVSSFTSTDNVGSTGFLITETAAVPSASVAGWSSTAPATYSFSGTGSRTAYAWVKDAVGNVSIASTAPVIIDTVLPVITSMVLIPGSSNLTVKVAASDDQAVGKMHLYLDNQLQYETEASSFSYSWSPSSRRAQTMTVMVHDKAGNVRSQVLKVWKN